MESSSLGELQTEHANVQKSVETSGQQEGAVEAQAVDARQGARLLAPPGNPPSWPGGCACMLLSKGIASFGKLVSVTHKWVQCPWGLAGALSHLPQGSPVGSEAAGRSHSPSGWLCAGV